MDKYLLDENLSKRMAVDLFSSLGTVSHIKNEPLVHFTDIEIWNYARDNNFTIITKDSDFVHHSNLKGCPPKVIRLKCGNKTTSFIYQLLVTNSVKIQAFIGGNDCYLEIL